MGGLQTQSRQCVSTMTNNTDNGDITWLNSYLRPAKTAVT